MTDILDELFDVIQDRKIHRPAGSYTVKLLDGGDEILKKVGEEAAEVIIAAKNEDNDEVILETSDLLYHLLVLMNYHEINLEEIYAELANRFGK